MHFSRLRQFATLGVLVSAFSCSVAHGGIFRAYLSLGGSDANPCTLPQPCRLLPAALAAANDGGEIWMLDSANFNTGPVTIDKSIKILAIPGEVGSIVGNGGDALIINAPLKDVTLRNLVILNLAGGINGVNIQNADAVHIEKSTIHDFSDPAGSCVTASSTATVRVYIDDSFFRHCRAAVKAVFPTAIANRPTVFIDNTRIERAFASSGAGVGILQQGCVDVTLRNSMLTRQDASITADTLVAGCNSKLELVNTQVTRTTDGIQVNGATANAQFDLSIVNSQITNISNDSLRVTNSGNTTSLNVNLAEAHISHCGSNCIVLVNNATDSTQGINVNIARSYVGNTSGNALDLNSPSGSRVRAWIRDSTLSGATGRLVKTAGAGASTIQVSLIRSNLNNAGFGVDHGFGTVRLDGCHITNLTNSLVNSGSGDISSLGNNWMSSVNNASGLTYITPTVIPPI